MRQTAPRKHPGPMLDAYLDGELTRRERREVERHLRTCPRCRAELEANAALRASLRTLPVLSCPEGVMERLPLPGRAQPARKRVLALRPRLAWRLALAGAAAAVALFLVIRRPALPPQPEESAYSPEQVVRARHDVELAFAYVNHALRLTERTLQEEVLPSQVVEPLKRGVSTAFGVLTQEGIQ
ncbi:MAG: zf-HC2 domain-containing protein [Calditrichaeota bacterium]|nr:zf-HC2 domain-containing protein [Calditrichota bacterium]